MITVQVEWSIIRVPPSHRRNKLGNIDPIASYTITSDFIDRARPGIKDGIVSSRSEDGCYVLTDVRKRRGQIVAMRVVVEGAFLGVI